MILTDGDITDKRETISAIVESSNLPLSIVIVGVGNHNFDAMNDLDADEKPLLDEKTDTYCSRDIVQFVPFNQFKSNPARLAEVTLAEIPRQVTEFMGKYRFVPNTRIAVADNFVYGESAYEEH